MRSLQRLELFSIHIILVSGADDYCNYDTFVAECKQEEVIMMTEAKYGRMELGKCVVEDVGGKFHHTILFSCRISFMYVCVFGIVMFAFRQTWVFC